AQGRPAREGRGADFDPGPRHPCTRAGSARRTGAVRLRRDGCRHLVLPRARRDDGRAGAAGPVRGPALALRRVAPHVERARADAPARSLRAARAARGRGLRPRVRPRRRGGWGAAARLEAVVRDALRVMESGPDAGLEPDGPKATLERGEPRARLEP